MQIEYYGHSCFAVSHAGFKLLIDPYDEQVGYKMPNRGAQLTLVSHEHFDHNCVRAVSGRTQVIRGTAPHDIQGIKIRGVLAEHGGGHGIVTVFCWEWNGTRFCHLSDVGPLPDKKEIGPVDVLFVPIGGGNYTMDPKEARKAIEALQPGLAIPMHYRTPFLNRALFPDLQPLEAFGSCQRHAEGPLDLNQAPKGVVALSHLF